MTGSIVRNAKASSPPAPSVRVVAGTLVTLLGITAALTLSGCGLAETGAVAASVAASKAEEAKQAKETEARMERKINEAYKAAADQRHAADADPQ